MSEGDGIDEVLEGAARIIITAAGRVGERLARLREEFAREARARSLQEARELQARYDAERAAARSELRATQDPGWWDRADANTIARAHEVATAWRSQDPEIDAAAEQIREGIRDRYGFDVNDTTELTRELMVATEEAARARQEETAERAKAAEEAAEAQQLMAEADALDAFAKENHARADELERDVDFEAAEASDIEAFERAQESRDTGDEQATMAGDARGKANDLYDSAERREKFADDLAARGANADQVRGRLLADVDQAKHPSEAVAARKSAKARPSRGMTGADRGRTRGR